MCFVVTSVAGEIKDAPVPFLAQPRLRRPTELLGAAGAGEVELARVVGQVHRQLRPVFEPETSRRSDSLT